MKRPLLAATFAAAMAAAAAAGDGPLDGLCIRPGDTHGLDFEAIRLPDGQMQIWMGQHTYIHMFESLLAPGVRPGDDNVIRVTLGAYGIALTYDTISHVGTATMAESTFDNYFSSLNTGTGVEFNRWQCGTGPLFGDPFRIPPALLP